MHENTAFLQEGERIDDLERSGLKIIQNPRKFCFGMDAVLLSGFARIKQGEMSADIGTGTGIIPILLTAKSRGKKFIGIEIQEDMANMAKRSVALNKLEDRIEILCRDIREIGEEIPSSSLDAVLSNPPYMVASEGLVNQNSGLAIARHEIKCSLSDVLREGARMLKKGGRLYMVHRPHRLGEIICRMREHALEAKRIRLVHPYKEKPANLVLIEAAKGGGVWMDVEAPLIIYEAPGKYTREIFDLYGY